jgi:ABC-type phosphate transport system permease subunit
MSERKEAWMRIVVGIISGIILAIWKLLVEVAAIFHWIYVVFSGKRSRGIAEFCNIWATQAYRFIRYMAFTTNSRPFPFSDFEDAMHPVEIGSKKRIKNKKKK